MLLSEKNSAFKRGDREHNVTTTYNFRQVVQKSNYTDKLEIIDEHGMWDWDLGRLLAFYQNLNPSTEPSYSGSPPKSEMKVH